MWGVIGPGGWDHPPPPVVWNLSFFVSNPQIKKNPKKLGLPNKGFLGGGGVLGVFFGCVPTQPPTPNFLVGGKMWGGGVPPPQVKNWVKKKHAVRQVVGWGPPPKNTPTQSPHKLQRGGAPQKFTPKTARKPPQLKPCQQTQCFLFARNAPNKKNLQNKKTCPPPGAPGGPRKRKLPGLWGGKTFWPGGKARSQPNQSKTN